jgi:hypothetical protein
MYWMRIYCFFIVCLFFVSKSHLAPLAAQDSQKKKIDVSCQKIWDQANHNAFTDLIKWKQQIYCAFRTGNNHVPRRREDDGKIQIISTSDEGKTWESVIEIAVPNIDLRDPKLSVTPDDRLMILAGGSHYKDGQIVDRIPYVAFLSDRQPTLGDSHQVEIHKVVIDPSVESPNDWLWRVTWHEGAGYGVVYQSSYENGGLHLVKTTDGIKYQCVKSFDLGGKPNETTVRFDNIGTMHVVVRNDELKMGHYGVSESPFESWTWQKVAFRLGGPDLIQLPQGKWMLGTRAYGTTSTTVVGQLNGDGTFDPMITLPSGGDTSYPGFLLHDDELWVSYYSSHEGRTSIYLAKVKLSDLENK